MVAFEKATFKLPIPKNRAFSAHVSVADTIGLELRPTIENEG